VKLEPVADAFKRFRRDEIFAAHVHLSTDDAKRSLGAVLLVLRPFHGRAISRSSAIELIREAKCADPVRFFDALHTRAFFTSLGGRYRVDIAPRSFCEIPPPLAPGSAEKRVLGTLNAWLEWLYEREKENAKWAL
jgi:hypothetical protein